MHTAINEWVLSWNLWLSSLEANCLLTQHNMARVTCVGRGWWKSDDISVFFSDIFNQKLFSNPISDKTDLSKNPTQCSILMSDQKELPFLSRQKYVRLSNPPLHPWLDSDYVGQHFLAGSLCLGGGVAEYCRGRSCTERHAQTLLNH